MPAPPDDDTIVVDPTVPPDQKRFFVIDDGDVDYWIVALDMEGAKHTVSGVEFGDGCRLDDAIRGGMTTLEEISAERAATVTCHIKEDANADRRSARLAAGRNPIPLAECEVGEWFCSEW
jgi:hypothetical protein